MGIETIWLKHLRAIVRDESGGGEITPEGRKIVADALDRNEQALDQILRERKRANGSAYVVGKALAAAIERKYARGRQPGWINVDPEEGPVARLAQAAIAGVSLQTQRYAQHLANLLEDITDIDARKRAYNAAVDAILGSGSGEQPDDSLGNGTNGR